MGGCMSKSSEDAQEFDTKQFPELGPTSTDGLSSTEVVVDTDTHQQPQDPTQPPSISNEEQQKPSHSTQSEQHQKRHQPNHDEEAHPKPSRHHRRRRESDGLPQKRASRPSPIDDGDDDRLLPLPSSSSPPRRSGMPSQGKQLTVTSTKEQRQHQDHLDDVSRLKSLLEGDDENDFHSCFVRSRDLGYGSFSQVYVGIHIKSNQRFAVKQVVNRSLMQWNQRDALLDEISNLRRLQGCPNICHLLKVYQQVFLVMELVEGGELFDCILKKKTFTEQEACNVSRSLLLALKYMHQRRICHRDVKPENVLLVSQSSDTMIKLADFGFSRHLTRPNECRTLCGTPGYLAPEILEKFPAYDTKCDLWSVGVLLFVLLGGYLPFDCQSDDEIFEKTRNGRYSFHPDSWKGVSTSAKQLVMMLLTVNPKKRASASFALQQPWIQRTDLDKKKLSVKDLQRSILIKKKNDMHEKDPLRKLNNDFESYLRHRSDSMTVFSTSNASKLTKVTREEDSSTGLPFEHFYTVGDLLGEGGFGVVRRAQHKTRGDTVAVKIVDRYKLTMEGGTQALQDEIAALKLLRGGPHIVRLHDVFSEERFTFIVMEEMSGGELLRRIVDKETYTEREARNLCMILFKAVDYMHKKKICHRDLKPENLLLTEQNDDTSIKIADFGFAKRVSSPNCLNTLCGTALYVAPEVLDLTSKGYDQRADMWSVGVIVYILLGGYAPFDGPVEELANVIMRGAYTFHDKYWMYTSTNAKDLISSCLQVNPNLRITAEEALQSEWMTVEEESLTANDLSMAQEQIRKELPLAKFKGAVYTVMLTNKFKSLGNSFTSTLGDAESIQMQQQNRGENRASAKKANREGSSNMSTGKRFEEVYNVGVALGSGSYSVVHDAVHKKSKREYAVKIVNRLDLHPADAVALQAEISALQRVKLCKHIIRLYDVFDEPDTTYLILERMHGGELLERIINRAHYEEADARALAKNLLRGVEYCHRRKIANRNLKPENILLVSQESDVDVKISDFGCAKMVLFPNSLRTQCGTEGYIAPEILEHRCAYDEKCDMWSLGVILYIVLGGYRPFRGTSDEVMRQIRYGEYEFHERYWRSVTEEAKSLIRSMMTVEPAKRISASDALKHSWILLAESDNALRDSSSASEAVELKTLKAKAKIRQIVQLMVAANKLQRLGKHYQKFEDF